MRGARRPRQPLDGAGTAAGTPAPAADPDGRPRLLTRTLRLARRHVGLLALLALAGWRDLKTHLELRPVYHRLEHRIRAHILLCWLDLLLVRIMETRTGRTWAAVREELQDLHVGAFTQTSQPTAATKTILAALDIPPAKNILRLDPAT